jgi:hypothetical protein
MPKIYVYVLDNLAKGSDHRLSGPLSTALLLSVVLQIGPMLMVTDKLCTINK